VSHPRRSFLGRLGGLLALGALPTTLDAAERRADRGPAGATVPGASAGPDERWLDAIAGKEHRLFVEMGSLTDVIAFRRTLNFLDVYDSDFGVPGNRLGVAVGMHGGAIGLALGDALWAKYRIGERADVRDAAGRPVTANPARAGSAPTIEGLAARGVHLLACNRSLIRLAGQLAGTGGNAAAIHGELVAGVLPQVQVVPALIVAVSRAQERGVPYLAIG
jgi:intracellular sulfur oxidation DsrE/DsrF family protein